MARQQDRRVQRTRKLLRESLISLILEEGYDEISILDITEKANLGRATFYLHFRDKDELLLEVMDQLVVDFFDQVPQLTAAHWHLEDTKTIIKLFEFAADHYDLYRILTIGKGGITAARQLHRSIAENVKEFLQSEVEALGTETALPIDFIANHFTGSLLAIIYWWLNNDLPYSAEEMAKMFQLANQLDRKGLLDTSRTEEASEARETQSKRKKRGREKEQVPDAKNTSGSDSEDEPDQETAFQADQA